jgi:hypothetical protein
MATADILKYFKAERTIQVEAGHDIRQYLEQNDLLAVLKSGEAQFVSAGGKTTITLKPGTPLGMFKSEPAEKAGRVTAISQCELIPLDEKGIRTLIEFNPRFTNDLLGVLRDNIGDLIKILP